MDSAELNLMRFRAKELNKLLIAPAPSLEVKTEDSLDSYKSAWAYNDPPESTDTNINLDPPSHEVKVENRVDSIRLQNLKEEVIFLLTHASRPFNPISTQVAESLWDEFCRRHSNPLKYTRYAIGSECESYLNPTDSYETAEAYDRRKFIERQTEEARESNSHYLLTRIKLILVSILISTIIMLLFLNYDGKHLSNTGCSICHPVVYK